MTTAALIAHIHRQKSFLCVGLDTDLEKIPPHLLDEEDPLFSFNKAIIDATHPYCVAFKPNLAFYEAYGTAGWHSLERTMTYLTSEFPDHFTIADAKRGDIGNTSSRYARAFFEILNFDAITVSPYMGRDSIEPFLSFEDRHTILLALTSNEGASDFQSLPCGESPLYKKVIETSLKYRHSEKLMFVVGGTKAEYLKEIRELIPGHFLLVPGIGAQGGSLREVCRYGLTPEVGLLINASRSIIYASAGKDYAQLAAQKAKELQARMALELQNLPAPA